MKITIKKASIVTIEADAIVSPANSYGYMGGGVAAAIKAAAGPDIEEEAIEKAPIPIGEAIETSAGYLKPEFIIHAPTMEEPGEKCDEHKVKCALEAALAKAEELGVRFLAVPGLGTGVGAVPYTEAAKAMISVLKQHEGNIEEVILVALNDEMIEAWEKALGKKTI